MTLRETIRDGLDSGFPLCCIAYFVVRMAVWRLTGKLIQLRQPKGSQHVLCPFHVLFHKFIPMRPYHNCGTCNWQQYAKSKCVKCVHCKHQYERGATSCTLCSYRRGPIGFVMIRTTNPPTAKPIYEERDFGENYENRI